MNEWVKLYTWEFPHITGGEGSRLNFLTLPHSHPKSNLLQNLQYLVTPLKGHLWSLRICLPTLFCKSYAVSTYVALHDVTWRNMVHGCMDYTERAETASVSRGTSHVTTKQHCKYTNSVDIENALYKSYSHLSRITCGKSAMSLLENGE